MAKNLCLVCQLTPSSFQIWKEVQKPYCERGPGLLYFLDKCPNFFFQLPKLSKCCLGIELDPVHQVIKKNSKWIICGSTRCIPLHAATASECDKKKK